MQETSKNSGFTMIEVIMSAALFAIVFWAIASLMHQYSKQNSSVLNQVSNDMQAQSIAFFLSQYFDGGKSFQALAFSGLASQNVAPAGYILIPWAQTVGPGFIVFPNFLVTGAVSPGNDTVLLISRLPTTDMVINVGFGPLVPGSNVSIRSVNGLSPISSQFSVGEMLVLSNLTSSEVLQITSAPSPAGTASSSFLLNAASFAPTFIAPGGSVQTAGTYMDGDPVYRANAILIGKDALGNLVSVSAGTSTIIAKGVAAFSVLYQLGDPTLPGQCDNVVASATFARDQWWALTTGANCYRRIQTVQFQFTQNAQTSTVAYATNQ